MFFFHTHSVNINLLMYFTIVIRIIIIIINKKLFAKIKLITVFFLNNILHWIKASSKSILINFYLNNFFSSRIFRLSMRVFLCGATFVYLLWPYRHYCPSNYNSSLNDSDFDFYSRDFFGFPMKMTIVYACVIRGSYVKCVWEILQRLVHTDK